MPKQQFHFFIAIILYTAIIQLLSFFMVSAASAALKPPLDPPFVCTSPFGEVSGLRNHVHKGIDIGIPMGTPVYAIDDGTVVRSDYDEGGYGYWIAIQHYSGIGSVYAHLNEQLVHTGQEVKKGEIIAYSGNSGHSTGPHLHFEIVRGDVLTGTEVDPGLYISALFEAERNAGGYNPGGTQIITLEIVEDFAKVVRDLINKTVEFATNGISLIKDMIYKLFAVLLTIDLAWAIASRMQEPEQGRFFVWLAEKFILYGCLVFLITHWSDVVSGLALHSFPAIGAMEAGSNLEEAGRLLSDPSGIIQKGMSLVAQLLNELLTLTSIADLLMLNINIIACGIFGIIFTLCFFLIGIQLAKAYLQFYFTVLMSFTGFLFSGWSYTRKYGANALNGVFVASLNLMFFCVFAFMLTNTMQSISTAEFITQANNPESAVAAGKITSQDQLLAGMRRVESYNSNYHCDNGAGYYGAYQICKDYWDSWCNDYMANRGNGPALDDDSVYIRFYGNGEHGTAPEPANTAWPWSPRNQDLVAKFITFGYYQEFGSWEAAARAWNQGTGGMENAAAYEYQRKVAGSVGHVVEKRVNYIILFKLLIVLLIFMKMADVISGRFMKQFGQPGFKLGNEQQ